VRVGLNRERVRGLRGPCNDEQRDEAVRRIASAVIRHDMILWKIVARPGVSTPQTIKCAVCMAWSPVASIGIGCASRKMVEVVPGLVVTFLFSSMLHGEPLR
jgi:hypothetical protein